MACLFCNSYHHQSRFCDKYKNLKAQKGRPNSARFCFTCRTDSDFAHLPEQEKCENDNCVGWFSTEHHALFCLERVRAQKFLPNIDQILLKRFVGTLNIEEKLSFILSSPSYANLVTMDPIKILDTLEPNKYRKCINSDVVFFNNNVDLFSKTPEKINKLLASVTVKKNVFVPRILRIERLELPSKMVLIWLSSYTREFKLCESFFSSNLSFSDIIKAAPNLQTIICFKTNITYENSWLKDLLKHKNGKNFHHLDVMLNAVELDVESLVEFVKTKCSNTTKIIIKFKENGQKYDEIAKKLSEYFDHHDKEGTWLRIGYYKHVTDVFSLEKIKNSMMKVMA